MSSSDSSLSHLKCLVTGASSGIGRETCRVLSRKGATVVGTARNESSLAALKQEGVLIDYIVADITKDGVCKDVVEKAGSTMGGISTVVNAAGVLQGGAMGSVDLTNYHHNMACNTQAPFEILMCAIPLLKLQKDNFPSIINVSSVNGKQSFAGCVTYCMSKAALDQLTRCASIDLAHFGIRVNSVNPGVIETNLQKAGGMSDAQYAAFLERSIETTHPLAKSLGRVGKPEEVGELIAFLVSDKAKFITVQAPPATTTTWVEKDHVAHYTPRSRGGSSDSGSNSNTNRITATSGGEMSNRSGGAGSTTTSGSAKTPNLFDRAGKGGSTFYQLKTIRGHA